MESKYIVILQNQAKFIQHRFTSSKIEREASLKVYPLSPEQRTDFVNVISRTELNLSDSIWNIGGLL
jgi:hypothetical protein